MSAGFQTWLDTFIEQGYLIMDEEAQKHEADALRKRTHSETPQECPSPVKKAKVDGGATLGSHSSC